MANPSISKVKVYLRCRPLEEKDTSCVVDFPSDQRSVVVVDKRARDRKYELDAVFNMNSRQSQIYEQVARSVVQETVKGYNCTIFAYGQTGTGKTYTIVGDRSDPLRYRWADDPRAGIIPRSIADIFKCLTATGLEFSVRVSFLEIYNEALRDLLYIGVDPPKLQIYDCQTNRGAVRVQNLAELAVTTPEQAYDLLEKGMRNRQTAATQMNLLSSRSHAVFTLQTTLRRPTMETGKDQLVMGKLHLVDLAGSECIGRSGATDFRAREAGKINTSLLTLERVINALIQKGHVPFRESKLTRLLQDSLGGSTKTSIIATISPCRINLEETLSTLDYAHKARDITNRPVINLKEQSVVLQDYELELRRLREDLAATREKQGVYLSETRYQDMLDKIDLLENKCKTMAEDLAMKNETVEELMKDNRHLRRELRAEKLIVEAHASTEVELHRQAQETLAIVLAAQTFCTELKEDVRLCLATDRTHRQVRSVATEEQLVFLQNTRELVDKGSEHLQEALNKVTDDLAERQESLYSHFQTGSASIAQDLDAILAVIQEGSEWALPLLHRVLESLAVWREEAASLVEEQRRTLQGFKDHKMQHHEKWHTLLAEYHAIVEQHKENAEKQKSSSEDLLREVVANVETGCCAISVLCKDIRSATEAAIRTMEDESHLVDLMMKQEKINQRRKTMLQDLLQLEEEEKTTVATFRQEYSKHLQSSASGWRESLSSQQEGMADHLQRLHRNLSEYSQRRTEHQSLVDTATRSSTQSHDDLKKKMVESADCDSAVGKQFGEVQIEWLDRVAQMQVSKNTENSALVQEATEGLRQHALVGKKVVEETRVACSRQLDTVASHVSESLRHASGCCANIVEQGVTTLQQCTVGLANAGRLVQDWDRRCAEKAPPLAEIRDLVARGNADAAGEGFVRRVPLPWAVTQDREAVLSAYKRRRSSRRSGFGDYSRDDSRFESSEIIFEDVKENIPV